MNNTERNDAKRAEMAQLVTGLLRHGWTRATVAQRLGISSGTVGSWARGKSMGTNAQRAELRMLLQTALKDEARANHRESCSPGCPGWVHDVTGAIQACDACGRFKLPGGGSDDDAAKAAHDARFKDEDCPDCEPDPFADEAHPIVPDSRAEPKPVLPIGVRHYYQQPDGTYWIDGTFQRLPCGCEPIGVGIIPAPFTVKLCSLHAAARDLLEALSDALRALQLSVHLTDCPAYKQIGRYGSRSGLYWCVGDESTCGGRCDLANRIARARAAIAKAEGRS